MLNSFRVVFITTDGSGGPSVNCTYIQSGDDRFYSFDWGSAPTITYDPDDSDVPAPTDFKFYGYDARTIRDIFETYGMVDQPIAGIPPTEADYGVNPKLLANYKVLGEYTRQGTNDLLSPSVTFPDISNDLGNTYCRPTSVNQDTGENDPGLTDERIVIENDSLNTKKWPKYIYLGAIGAGAYGQGCLVKTNTTLGCQDVDCGNGHICGRPNTGFLDEVRQKGGDGSQASTFLEICGDVDRNTLTVVCKLGKGGVQKFNMIDDIETGAVSTDCFTIPHHDAGRSSPHSSTGSYTTFPTQADRMTTIKVYEGEEVDATKLILTMSCPGGEPPRLEAGDLVGPREILESESCSQASICGAFDDDSGNSCCCPACCTDDPDAFNGKNGSEVANSVGGGDGSVILKGVAWDEDKYALREAYDDQSTIFSPGTAFNETLGEDFGIDSNKGWHRTSVAGARDESDNPIEVYTEAQIARFYEPGMGGNGKITYWADNGEVTANRDSAFGFTGEGAGGNGGSIYVGYGPEVFTKAIETEEPFVSVWDDIGVAQAEIDAATTFIDFGQTVEDRRYFIQKVPTDTSAILEHTFESDFEIAGGLFSSGVPLEDGWVDLVDSTAQNIYEYDWTYPLSIENNSRLIDEPLGSSVRIEFVRADLQFDNTHNPALILEGASEVLDANWTTLIDPLGNGPNGITTNTGDGPRGNLSFNSDGYLVGMVITNPDLVEKIRALKTKIDGSTIFANDISDLLIFYWVSPNSNRTNRIAEYIDLGSMIMITFAEPDTSITSDYGSYFLFTFGGHPAFLIPGDGGVFGTNPTIGRSLCAFTGVRDDSASGKIYYRPIGTQPPGPLARVQFHTEGIKIGAADGVELTLSNMLADGSARDSSHVGGNIIVSDEHKGTLVVDSCTSSLGQSGIRTEIPTGEIQLKDSLFEKTNGRNAELLGGGENGHEVHRCTFGSPNHKDSLLFENSPNSEIHECLFGEIFNTGGRAFALNNGSAWGSKVHDNLFINSLGFRESNTNSYAGSVDPTRYDYLAEYNNLYYVDKDKNIKNDSEQTWAVQDASLKSDWRAVVGTLSPTHWNLGVVIEDPLRTLWGLTNILGFKTGAGTDIPELWVFFDGNFERNSSVSFGDGVATAQNFLSAHQNDPHPFTINGESFNGWNDTDTAGDPICLLEDGFLKIRLVDYPELYNTIADAATADGEEFSGTFYRPGKTRKLVQELEWTMKGRVRNITVKDNEFDAGGSDPTVLTGVRPGDTVRWIWGADVTNFHNVTAGVPCVSSGLFASDTIDPSLPENDGYIFEWEVPADVANSTIDYFCSLHCPQMVGQIEVGDNTGPINADMVPIMTDKEILWATDRNNVFKQDSNNFKLFNGSYSSYFGTTLTGGGNPSWTFDSVGEEEDYWKWPETTSRFTVWASLNDDASYVKIFDPELATIDQFKTTYAETADTDWDLDFGDVVKFKVYEEVPSGVWGGTDTFTISGSKLRMVNNSLYVDARTFTDTDNWRFGTVDVVPNTIEWHLQNNFYANGVQMASGDPEYKLFSDFNASQTNNITGTFFSATDLPYSQQYWTPIDDSLSLSSVDTSNPQTSAHDGGKIGNRWTYSGEYLTSTQIRSAVNAVDFFSDTDLDLNKMTHEYGDQSAGESYDPITLDGIEPEDNPRWSDQAVANDPQGVPVDNRDAGVVQASDVDVLKLAVVPEQTVSDISFIVQVLAENIDPAFPVGHNDLSPTVTLNGGGALSMSPSFLKWPDPATPGGFTTEDSVGVWEQTITLSGDATNIITVSSSTEDITFNVHHKAAPDIATVTTRPQLQTQIREALTDINPAITVIELNYNETDLGEALDEMNPISDQTRTKWLTIKPASGNTVTWNKDSGAPTRIPSLSWLALENVIFGSDTSDDGGGAWELDAGHYAWLNNCQIRGKYKNSVGRNTLIVAPPAELITWSSADAQNRYFTTCYFDGTVTEGAPTSGAILTRDCAFSSHRTDFNQEGSVWLNCAAQDVQSIQDNTGSGLLEQRGIELSETTSEIIYKGFKVTSPNVMANFDPFILEDTTQVTNLIIDNISLGDNSNPNSSARAKLSGELTNTRISACSFKENNFELDYFSGLVFLGNAGYISDVDCELVRYKGTSGTDIDFDRIYFEDNGLDPSDTTVVANTIEQSISEAEVNYPDFSDIGIKVYTVPLFSAWQENGDYQWTTDQPLGGNFINTLGTLTPNLNKISTKSQSATPVIHDVAVKNFEFDPPNIDANPGDTIRWTWVEGMHSVTSRTEAYIDDAPTGELNTCNNPPEQGPYAYFSNETGFNTGTHATGAVDDNTLAETGEFEWVVPEDLAGSTIDYFCIPHCPAMSGTITIGTSSVSSTANGLYLEFDTEAAATSFVTAQATLGINLTVTDITDGTVYDYIWSEGVSAVVDGSPTEVLFSSDVIDDDTLDAWPSPNENLWDDNPEYNLLTTIPSTEITQTIGTTEFSWVFDGPIPNFGTFVDGSPWVVLPTGTKLESVSPAPITETINGFTVHMNGVSINTHTGNEITIGSDGVLALTIGNEWKTTDNRSTTTNSLDTHFDQVNFATYRDQLSTVQLNRGDMILLTESFFDENDESGIKYTGVDTRTPIKQQAVLTILSEEDAANASTSFRPPVQWAAQTGNRIDDGMFDSALVDLTILDHTQDSDLVLTDRDIAPVSTDNLLVGPILQYTDFTNSYESYSEYPAAIAQDNVGINIAGDVTEASNLVSILNHVLNEATNTNNDNRADYLRKIVQYGIDCYGAITTLGILGKSKDAGKAGMLKQWALFAMYALGQTDKMSVDDILGNIFSGYGNVDQVAIKSRLFQEDNTLREVADVDEGGVSYRISDAEINYHSSSETGDVGLADQSTQTTYSYDTPFENINNFGSLTLTDNPFSNVDNYSNLIGTVLTVNNSDEFYITMATDQFEDGFTHFDMLDVPAEYFNITGVANYINIAGLGGLSSSIGYDWGVTGIKIEEESVTSGLADLVTLFFEDETQAETFLALQPPLQVGRGENKRDLNYAGAWVSSNFVGLPNAFSDNAVLAANLLNPGTLIDISYARPYRLWVDRRWSGKVLSGDETFSIAPYNSKDQGIYVFCMPGNDGEGDITDDVVSPSPYNSIQAQVSGRAWLPAYAALHKLYTATSGYDVIDLGVTNKWLKTYIFEDIAAGNAKRNWMVPFNNSQESFGKIEAPATFSNWI